jgi:hypothetical protein
MTIFELGCKLSRIDPSPIGDADLLPVWLTPPLLDLLDRHGELIQIRGRRRVYLPGEPGTCIPTSLRYALEHPDAQPWLGFGLFVVRGENTRWHLHALVLGSDGTIFCPSRNKRLHLLYAVKLGLEVYNALPKQPDAKSLRVEELPPCLRTTVYANP